jgi:phage gp46-like protein
MDTLETLLDKQVNKNMDKLFGDADNELKIVTKLTLLKRDEELKSIVENIKESNEQLMQMVNEELVATLDAEGNVVLINES